MPRVASTLRQSVNADAVLAELATTSAGASRVFLRHGLDFCCHGDQSIAMACTKKGIDAEQVVAELRAETVSNPVEESWQERPLAQLIAHIVDHFHAGHRAEVPRLAKMAERVEAVHGEKPDCPRGLAAHLHFMVDALEQHMQKEEQILFPMLLAGQGAQAGGPIAVMEREHDEHGQSLAKMRRLAGDFVPPPAACRTWQALYLGLAELERDVMQHVALENHVLFPRAGA